MAMCAACVAQGIGYVGTALAGLQVMGARAKAKRRRPAGGTEAEAETGATGEGLAASEPVDEPVGV